MGNVRKNHYNGRIALFAIMIGFCILALIEIVYGQAQLRVEKERLALEEANHQAVQELKEEWNALKDTNTAVPEDVMKEGQDNTVTQQQIVSSTNKDGQSEEAKQPEETKQPDSQEPSDTSNKSDNTEPSVMQIVIFGDSITDNDREDGGVGAWIGANCKADVYNLAIGGTTAALIPKKEQYDFNNWNSISLLGVVNAILGNVSQDIFKDYRAGQLMKECDFSKTDYFIIEFGINDFQAQIPQSIYLENGGVRGDVDRVHTYVGALERAIQLLQEAYPDAKIILASPHYCQFFNAQTFIGDAYSLDFGYGALVEYARSCENLYVQHKEENILFYNAFEDSGIKSETADWYLEDGIHLNAEGRRVYAEVVSRLILDDFYPEE